MLRLSEEQLVVIEPRQGAFVRRLRPEEVLDIYGVRIALEALAARTVARNPPGTAAKRFTAALDRMANARKGAFAERVEADIGFHYIICALSGNPWLVSTWSQLSGPIRVALISAGADAIKPYQSPEHHESVMEAILRRDDASATDLLVKHLQDSASALASELELIAAIA
jgi:DNA-binding GntR family transcriptional regulator